MHLYTCFEKTSFIGFTWQALCYRWHATKLKEMEQIRPDENHHLRNMLPSAHEVMIQTIVDCAIQCENCFTASIWEEESSGARLARCIQLSRDCADICMHAARLLRRNSEIAYKYLFVCEEICRRCAEECMKHHHLEYCQECGDACLRCAEVCYEAHAAEAQNNA